MKIEKSILVLLLFSITTSDLISAEALPSRRDIIEICSQLTDSISRELIVSEKIGVEDLNNDGVIESCNIESDPSETICSYNFDSNGENIQINPMGYTDEDNYLSEGTLKFRNKNRTYILHSSDANNKFIRYLSYVTPQNDEYSLCSFAWTSKIERINKKNPNNSQVCYAFEYNLNIRYQNLDDDIPDDKYMKPRDLGRKETDLIALGIVDFDNDGIKEPIVELAYITGALQGKASCKYYDVMDENWKNFDNGLKHQALLNLQGISIDDGRPRCQGKLSKLFRHDGRTYLYEEKIYNNQSEIRMLSNNNTHTVCSFERQDYTHIESILPFGP